MSCRNTRGKASANYKEVTVGTELFVELDRYQRHSECLTAPTIYALDAQPVTKPLLVPWPSTVHDPVTCHSPRAEHRGSVYFSQIYGVIFKTKGPNSSTSLTNIHRNREMNREMCWRGIHFPCPTAETCRRAPRKSRVRKKKRETGRKTTVNLTPFTPFKSPFSSESRVKITLWLRLWSWKRRTNTGSYNAALGKSKQATYSVKTVWETSVWGMSLLFSKKTKKKNKTKPTSHNLCTGRHVPSLQRTWALHCLWTLLQKILALHQMCINPQLRIVP